MPYIDRLGAGIELNRGRPLLLKGVGAGILEAAKGSLQGKPGGRFVDLDDTCLNAVGKGRFLLA